VPATQQLIPASTISVSAESAQGPKALPTASEKPRAQTSATPKEDDHHRTSVERQRPSPSASPHPDD
jgi:hypothetical protein